MAQIAAIIPTYNRAGLVNRAIASVLAQTFPPAEVIVVDDGSTDDTKRTIAQFGDKVRYIAQTNAGVSVARNSGAATASSAWLAFLDSDDTWRPDYLERVATAIDKTDGRAAVYFTDLDEEGSQETVWERSGLVLSNAFQLESDPSDWVMRPLQPMSIQASVIQRDAYWQVGGHRPGLPCREDTHLFFMLGFSGPACAVAGVGATLGCGAEEERLTRAHAPETPTYWRCTIAVCDDVLRHNPHIAGHHRRELRRRLAGARWRQARLMAADHAFGNCARALALSFVTAPSVLLRKAARI